MDLKIIFMGSPEFAVPVLEELAAKFTVECVFTQPDRPSGRKRLLKAPPVKKAAFALKLLVYQPEKLKSPEVLEKIKRITPDLIVVTAYGQILRSDVLNLPKYGCLNVHASLLPRWRGASPIYAAILAGDDHTGVTIMKMDEGIDTGMILAHDSLSIESDDTTESLSKKLALSGAKLLVKTIPGYIDGKIRLQKQDESKATYTKQLKKQDGLLLFDQPGDLLERQIRACQPWPGAYFYFNEHPMKVLKARYRLDLSLPAGSRGILEKYPIIGTSRGVLELIQMQPAGKTVMTGDQFLLGVRNWSQ